MQGPMISPSEIEVRHDKVRAFLADEGIGALLAYSPAHDHWWGNTGHVSYLSGWSNRDRIVDTVVVMPREGEPVLLASGMPYMFDQAREVSPIKDMRMVQALDLNAISSHRPGSRDFATEALAILEENHLVGEPIGLVDVSNMPAPFYEALKAELGDQLKSVPDIVAKLRNIKTPDELACMRRAAELSDLGFQAMLEAARPGMRGYELVAEMEHAVRRQGADHCKYWMASGPAPDWNDVRLDLKPHDREFEHGDLMASCSYIIYNGYWCHGHRTGTMGEPCEKLDELCRITREGHDAALSAIKPGIHVGHIGQAIENHAGPQGLPLLGGRIGHGMGLDYSEQPVPLDDANETPIEEGSTFVMHAVFALPQTGNMFVPLGDVVHVTADGPEQLMKFPRTPFVAGAGG